MDAVTLSTEAWHFRLANYGTRRISSYDLRVGIDICTYLKLVTAGLVVMITRIALVVLGVAWIGYSLYDLFLMAVFGSDLTPPAIMLVAVIAAMISALVIIGTVEWSKGIAERRRSKAYADKFERGIEEKPGFLKLAYRKFKDKTCFKIKFEDH